MYNLQCHSRLLLIDLTHEVSPDLRPGEDALDVLLSIVVLVEDVVKLRVCLLQLDEEGVLLVCLALHGGVRVCERTLLLFLEAGRESDGDLDLISRGLASQRLVRESVIIVK